MAPRLSVCFGFRLISVCQFFSIGLLGSVLATACFGKEAPVTAIELFDGPSGAAYVQVTDLLINGKAEVRICSSPDRIDKSAYGKLAKVALAGATSLERTAEGVLILTRNSEATCVVPSNLKFEKDWGTRASDIADHAVLQGRVLSPAGVTALPPFKPGVKIVFVSQPDTELAEFLRAQRGNTIPGWQDFLLRYPKSIHANDVRQSLATLWVKDGEAALAAYRKSTGTSAVSYGDLRQAWVKNQQALEMVTADSSAHQLLDEIHAELKALLDNSRSELSAYQQALSTGTAGYKHLGRARDPADRVVEVDSQFNGAQKLQANIGNETRAVENSLHEGETLAGAQRFDEALRAISKYLAFEGEEPRIAAVVSAAYKYHLDRGKAAENSQKWQDAVQEYQKAVDVTKTQDAVASLNRATVAYQVARDKAAADAALEQSEVYEQEKNFINAYEVLADLPDPSRALNDVKDRMDTLAPSYVKNASDEAEKIEQAHKPIHGKVDEIELQKAYGYLRRANTLDSNNQDLKLRLDLLSDTFSDYYLDLAKRYLDKPSGSGVGLAWLYLDEAQQYKANRDDVRDERTKSQPVHFLRSKLSIRVVFRDQTARKDTQSAGFADQLSDAIATGLETSGLPVKVVRASDSTAVEPNFRLVGDVLQHREVLVPTVEPMESKYRAGERELPNEDWNRANREYEAANLDLQNGQRILEGAQAHGKKKEIAEAQKQVAGAQAKVEEAHRKMDALPKTVPSDVVKPYTYTRKSYDLTAVTEIGFRIVDVNGTTIDTLPPITKQSHVTAVVLENVKPEDTEGVKEQGTPPDETQFVTDLDIQARDALIKAVMEKVQDLPAKILAQARQHVAEGDTDGAAEAYILYLNSTPDTDTTGREEAKHFLQEQFNIIRIASSAS